MQSLLTKISTWIVKRGSLDGSITDHLSGLSRGLRTMTKPISQERVEWLLARLKVVDACIARAQSQMYAMQSGGAQRADLHNALLKFQSERMTISVELQVLKDLGVAP